MARSKRQKGERARRTVDTRENRRNGVRKGTGCALEIVKRPKGERGFRVLPKRWAVERTLAWQGRHRMMGKDCEMLAETSEAWILTAMVSFMLRRLAA